MNSGVPILGKVINFKDHLPLDVTVIAAWQPWFGNTGHKNIPNYDSRDPQVCAAQTAAMKSMGIDAINVDWYGPDRIFENIATLHMLRACEDAGLKFSICIDHGSFSSTDLPRSLQYINETYVPSSAYLTDPSTGRPIVNFFGEPNVDLTPIKGNFLFLFEDNWTHANGDGAFGWIHPLPDPQDMNTAYLLWFNRTAATNSSKMTWYPVYPGFDDSQASWTEHRLMNRRNGLTLLDTLSQVPSTAKYVMLVTWNDHEESTAVELSQG